MHKRKRWASHGKLMLAGAMITGLAACGGGDGGSDGGPSTPPPSTGEPGIGDLAISPAIPCTAEGVGSTALTTDDPPDKNFKAAILEVSQASVEGGDPTREYCLVKVRVDPAIHIWVAMPSDGTWNGRFRSEGGGGYAGTVNVAMDSVRQGFVGVQTDTGHPASVGGAFGMLSPGVPNTQLQEDFAHRSEHLMAVVGKQLVKAYYGQDPVRSYWYGCSTGGRQGLMMAQRYPDDYDAILAGAPAIHWDRFQAYQIWPQVVMQNDLGAPIPMAKLDLATSRAVQMCDADDGVTDGVIDDPRRCGYDPALDNAITHAACTAESCLTPLEAVAIKKIWDGARNIEGELLWPGLERGTQLGSLAGATPFSIAVQQPRFWVYLDPDWDWKTLTYANYGQFFTDTVNTVGPVIATDNPDLTAFKNRGGKLIMYHGWSDPLIMPQGTIRYYENVRKTMGTAADDFAVLYMAPGMGHCRGGAGPNHFGQSSSGVVPKDATHDAFRALMDWSEKGQRPTSLIATKFVDDTPAQGVARTRPLCPYPQVARYTGTGSTDDAANFACVSED
ncbi:MAG: tannase/feruloyl esterase family alpha/beta hydrolase [Pigmentiphaga sp.]|uniref:tannase/feruloyl esterase family alpha/beta hydrolase n=1 Tax=Pigmentiphaga sp. TaxID=1977564 RepID=UPI0029B7B54F|nr:tannase/feruloyl esterase family alpha/beta hydrolase [Pigmentiphaga sp.]MDX3905449.1 tannase/feruloyl esterase family alpha/beta hydrolase [Pigmentiphaga sp.]